MLLETMKHHPETLKKVLDVFAQTMIDFANHCIDKGGNCVYFCTQSAAQPAYEGRSRGI